MPRKPAPDLTVASTHIYSLDRCIKCINTLKLGDKCFCTAVLRKEKPAGKGAD